MWNDAIKKRFFWMAIEADVNQLEKDLVAAEEIEECDLYLLSLYIQDVEDLDVFGSSERSEVLNTLSILIGDAKKHCRALSRIIKISKSYKEAMARS